MLATGELVTASATTNPDLFWAIRGGGGNFGVVTSFLFRLHPVSTVVAGPTLYALEDAADGAAAGGRTSSPRRRRSSTASSRS